MTKANNRFCWKDGIGLKEYVDIRLTAVEKSTTLAADTLEKRLEGMNEFRNQLNRQSATFVTKDELDLKIEGIEKGRKDSIALIISFIGIGIAIISFIQGR